MINFIFFAFFILVSMGYGLIDSSNNVASARVKQYMKEKGLNSAAGQKSGYTDESGDYYYTDKEGKMNKVQKKNLPPWFNETQKQAGE